ncbi:unnamed protein product [Rotaria sordida]|uniref:Glutathione transferase n=1 Tax=Rotaria sordida TaxID=392033 RepID=A0A819RGN8_9BILA|nr:unnamed protein product [Rotaria sordida]CAF4052080.1 unnamed protein product [Rotaria sordida]
MLTRTPPTMATYKLHYFNLRGRGEVARLIFAAAGQQFDDIRYERAEWPSHKAEMPLGQIPVLEFNGVKLPQSLAIARFLAKQFQFAGKDNLEQAKVDAVADTVADLMAKYGPTYKEQMETKNQACIQKFLAEELPRHLTNLETLGQMYSDGGYFFVGNHLTWVDLFLYDLLETIRQHDDHILVKYSWLKYNHEEVEKQPKIAAYLKSRTQIPV